MAVTATYTIYAVDIGGTLLHGITQQALNTGTEVQGEISSGEVAPRFQSITAQKPQAQFTTLEVAAALSACGTMGMNIDGTDVLLFAQKRAAGGTFASGSVHRKYTLQHGILVPRTLSCDHQGNAQLSYEAIVTYDGENDPIVIAVAQALVAFSGTVARYSLGAVSVGGKTLAQVRNVSIDFGLTVESEGADSDVWDTEATIREVRPKITVTVTDLSADSLALLGASGAASIQFRKRADGGTFAESGHLTITATGGLAYFDSPIDGSGSDSAQATIVCEPKYDGTNAPLVVA